MRVFRVSSPGAIPPLAPVGGVCSTSFSGDSAPVYNRSIQGRGGFLTRPTLQGKVNLRNGCRHIRPIFALGPGRVRNPPLPVQCKYALRIPVREMRGGAGEKGRSRKKEGRPVKRGGLKQVLGALLVSVTGIIVLLLQASENNPPSKEPYQTLAPGTPGSLAESRPVWASLLRFVPVRPGSAKFSRLPQSLPEVGAAFPEGFPAPAGKPAPAIIAGVGAIGRSPAGCRRRTAGAESWVRPGHWRFPQEGLAAGSATRPRASSGIPG